MSTMVAAPQKVVWRTLSGRTGWDAGAQTRVDKLYVRVIMTLECEQDEIALAIRSRLFGKGRS